MDHNIPEAKPGWLGRIFGIESGRLIACDARPDGEDWSRSEKFEFLYRGRLGTYYLLTAPREWHVVPEAEVDALYGRLPVKLEGLEVPAPVVEQVNSSAT